MKITTLRRSTIRCATIGTLVVVALTVAVCWFRPASIDGSNGRSIDILEQVELGGLKQWISIRGTDVDNPLLLFLHGGPGSANLAKLRTQCPELERHFVVINWDQRGAGKSRAYGSDVRDLTVDQLRQDTHQLVAYLRQRFGGRKVYLTGFSWGTVLGLWTAHDYPDDLAAFIGVGQIVSYAEGEALSLAYVRQVARDTRNRVALHDLEGIDPSYRANDWYPQLMRQRKWLLASGGVYHTASSYDHEVWMMLRASEYSLIDLAFWPSSSGRSLQAMWPDLMRLDFRKSVPEVTVPVYFLIGRHDYNAPSRLVETYYDQLSAPRGKHLIWFEESAHDLFFDQPDAVVNTIVGISESIR